MSEAKLKLWDAVYKTDPKYATNFKSNSGFRGTAIGAQYQVQSATEQFGPCGIGWGVKDEKFDLIKYDQDPKYHNISYVAILWYDLDGKHGEIAIGSDIKLWNEWSSGWQRNDDVIKKVKTDALTKGLSMLGFNADIFMNDFGDNKYTTGAEGDDSNKKVSYIKYEEFKKVYNSDDLKYLKKVHTGEFGSLSEKQLGVVEGRIKDLGGKLDGDTGAGSGKEGGKLSDEEFKDVMTTGTVSQVAEVFNKVTAPEQKKSLKMRIGKLKRDEEAGAGSQDNEKPEEASQEKKEDDLPF